MTGRQHMTDENAENSEKAVRLLDIVYDLYGNDKDYPYETLPFTVKENGDVVLSDDLMTKLEKEGNNDLIGWAHENIVGLFE
jgi:hypothetical protein